MPRVCLFEIILHMGLGDVIVEMLPARPFFEKMIGIAGYADNQLLAGAPVLVADEIAAVFRPDKAFGINKDHGVSPV